MVMMGQQLMDPERKQEDDDYVIQNHEKVQSLLENEHNCIDKMKKSEIPTLAYLAKRTHQNHLKVGESTEESNSSHLKLEAHKVFENGDGDGPQQHETNGDIPNSTTVTGTENFSSGRTSSCGGDSSGIGSSLTSSSSSEPIERDNSPTAENVVVVGSGASTQEVRCSQDVPDGVNIEDATETNGASNEDDDDGSCKALLLCEDFNGQMTAAKRFLQMVRDGIKDDDESTSISRCSKSIGGSEASTDDDSKPTILSSNIIVSNNNNNVNITKEKSPAGGGGGGGGGMGSGRSNKATNINIPPVVVPAPPITNILDNSPAPDCVQEVWAHNLLEEFFKIRQVVKKYNFIAMDTEFPGIVVRPAMSVRTSGVFPYELLKSNVDQLKIIQLGVTFMDKNGRTPEGVCTWQFNFKFCLNNDIYAADSISLLTRCGIQFEKHAEMGIEPIMFGEYFMSSGMVTSDHVTYLTFHSGFDFGYLIKLLSNTALPENEEKFFEYMRIYFPNVYDLKFLMRSVDLHGGLQDIANQMGQQRVGTQHQAGSDSLLTGMTFFKILQDVFNGEIDETKYSGKLYGFHMSAEDGRDEGWNDILDPTSPKAPQSSRSSNPTSVISPPQHSSAVPNLNGESGNGR